jgi:hypothetical protein
MDEAIHRNTQERDRQSAPHCRSAEPAGMARGSALEGECLSASAPPLRPYQAALVERPRAGYRTPLQLATGAIINLSWKAFP